MPTCSRWLCIQLFSSTIKYTSRIIKTNYMLTTELSLWQLSKSKTRLKAPESRLSSMIVWDTTSIHLSSSISYSKNKTNILEPIQLRQQQHHHQAVCVFVIKRWFHTIRLILTCTSFRFFYYVSSARKQAGNITADPTQSVLASRSNEV